MAFNHWKNHTLSFNNSDWPVFPAEVTRHPNRTELFSFVMDEILFLGQSLPGLARDAQYESKIRDSLLQDNAKWTEQALLDSMGLYRAVVVFANDFLDDVNKSYLDELLSTATDYGELPFLLLQNGQSFRATPPNTVDMDAPNVMWARTDDTVTPLAIHVDPWGAELEDIFQFDRRCYCTFGHRPTRLKTYLPWDKCAGVCDEAQSQCEHIKNCSPFQGNNTC